MLTEFNLPRFFFKVLKASSKPGDLFPRSKVMAYFKAKRWKPSNAAGSHWTVGKTEGKDGSIGKSKKPREAVVLSIMEDTLRVQFSGNKSLDPTDAHQIRSN